MVQKENTTDRPDPPDGTAAAHDRLRHAIDHAAHLLPAQGPISIFIHHNTLHAFEDRSFEEAVEEGARVFGCQPYLRMERYREALRNGRIRFADLLAVLEDELGLRAVEGVARLVNRLDLRLAVLQYPLRIGPANELQWFVAESDALRRVRPEVSTATRSKLTAETRRWVMRDLRGGSGRNGRPAWMSDVLTRFRETEIETWPEDTWEAFTLESLWRICLDGVRGVPQSASPPPVPVRRATCF